MSTFTLYIHQRVQNFTDELKELQIELEYGNNDYLKSLAQLDLWQNRESTRKLFLSDEERLAIEKLYAAKLDQIEKEHADAIAEYWKSTADIGYEMTHTAFEKELRDIELWKEAQEEKAATAEDTAAIVANAAAKEAQAFEREVDRIKGTMQTLDDKIFALDHSQYENDLRRIQQEYIRGIQEAQEAGTLPLMKDKLDYLYQRQKQELDRKAKEGGDYTKTPNGGLRRGGNGIVVIGGDTILDDGLTQAQTKNIDLLVDENEIRQFLMTNMQSLIAQQDNALQETLQSLTQYPPLENLPPQISESNFDTLITPLSSIEKIVGQIFSALSNQEARQINVSPNVDIDLGGAYVFDNEMKMSLVEDITNRIVTSITETVEKATSQRTYGFAT